MYDFIVIGSGTSGLSAAMYAARLNLKTLIIGEQPGGLITTTHIVENWPGTVSISGPDLGMAFFEHAQKSGAEFKNEKAISVEKKPASGGASDGEGEGGGEIFSVKTASGEYEGKSLLFATGTKHRSLDAPGIKEFENKGVSYCALCDGGFYKEKIVSVIGGGDSAAKEALFLSEHASKVYIFVRKDILRAEPINQELIDKNDKIEIKFKTEIAEVLPDESGEKVGAVRTKDGDEIPMDAIFLAIGHIAQTELVEDLGIELNEKKEIKIDRHSATNIPGVFSAGDCTDTGFKQAITGSAEGVTAAYYAFKHVKEDSNF
ncbi:FAD-dependent oxidoreductase [Candidatus Peregrinibacteria bacterium]|jgi:thioredoxin reductase (NADPH)|nr:FAD-dependent oxidoreductase [Candidatus Peregrinibacteria bacterium]MBT4148017.1 FAD-dependent oxidoreductase [Candidatus Peregrinibacteria bacterium]MBT4366756.1 FAD-dependent oxidoreductase [Candidatus Peregrinibacteria bacterium]MBT4456335.1 FAD-dependent oxidoreductase [Candidatus Peregrinibacteria bacterium]